MTDAVILAGGIARGAFGAGALGVLLRDVPDLALRMIVATSSGSLNGAYVASAVRSGTQRDAGAVLEELWRTRATAAGVFDVSLPGLLAREGLSTNAKLVALLRAEIAPSTAQHPIAFRVVLTATSGDVVTDAEGNRATTFEHVRRFHGSAFDERAALDEMFQVVSASCAFPGAFLPVTLDEPGGKRVRYYDGGLTDNSPIKHALDEPTVTRVFVIAPYPSVFEEAPQDRHGFALVEHMTDILVNERLYRDLKEAREVNRALRELDDLDHYARKEALNALRWLGRREVEIVEIRPRVALPGTAFDGLFSSSLREEYIQAGRAAATRWLEEEPT